MVSCISAKLIEVLLTRGPVGFNNDCIVSCISAKFIKFIEVLHTRGLVGFINDCIVSCILAKLIEVLHTQGPGASSMIILYHVFQPSLSRFCTPEGLGASPSSWRFWSTSTPMYSGRLQKKSQENRHQVRENMMVFNPLHHMLFLKSISLY